MRSPSLSGEKLPPKLQDFAEAASTLRCTVRCDQGDILKPCTLPPIAVLDVPRGRRRSRVDGHDRLTAPNRAPLRARRIIRSSTPAFGAPLTRIVRHVPAGEGKWQSG